MKLIIIKVSIFLLFLIVSIGFCLYFGLLRFNYPSKTSYPIRGIDISHHQGDIDWVSLNNEKLDFIYIKATEGSDYQDPKFIINWSNAIKYKYKVGAYHYYSACSSGIDQAENFIKTVPFDSMSLPPVVDLEFKDLCGTNKSKNEILLEINYFINSLKIYYCKTPLVYTTHHFYNEYLIKNMPQCNLWIRDVFCHPKIENDLWIIWQYSNRGKLSGINNYVDLNLMKNNTLINK